MTLELTVYLAVNDPLWDLAFIPHLDTGFSPQPRRDGPEKQY